MTLRIMEQRINHATETEACPEELRMTHLRGSTQRSRMEALLAEVDDKVGYYA